MYDKITNESTDNKSKLKITYRIKEIFVKDKI